jgi:hypothetical protein
MSDPKIYVKSQATIEVAHDSQFQELEYKRDRVTISEEYTYQESGTIVIAGGATTVVNLGSISEIKSGFIETEDQIDVVIDSSLTPVKLRPGTISGKSRLNLDGMSAAALSLTNPVSGGSGSARVSYQIAGD